MDNDDLVAAFDRIDSICKLLELNTKEVVDLNDIIYNAMVEQELIEEDDEDDDGDDDDGDDDDTATPPFPERKKRRKITKKEVEAFRKELEELPTYDDKADFKDDKKE